jgi:hypothetical protein
MVMVARVRAVEGCERKSRHTSKVFGRGLIGVMNEGVGQTAAGVAACMVATGLHDTALQRCVCNWRKCTCAFRMGETRRRIGGVECPQRVEWSDCTAVRGKRWWWWRGCVRWEGCERKSPSTSEVLGRELIDVMNEGVDTGGCMVAPCRAV